jgi:hypothetical protein
MTSRAGLNPLIYLAKGISSPRPRRSGKSAERGLKSPIPYVENEGYLRVSRSWPRYPQISLEVSRYTGLGTYAPARARDTHGFTVALIGHSKHVYCDASNWTANETRT